jgi:hypothetical protein
MSFTPRWAEHRELPLARALFGASGQLVAWLSRNRIVYLTDGTPVAWIARNGDVHGFDGDYLGWLQDGMLWDRQGRCALFSPQAQGGPSKPALRPEPPPSSFKEIPNRRSPEYPNSRPRRSSKWADVTDDGFFCPPARDYTPMRIVRRFPRGR